MKGALSIFTRNTNMLKRYVHAPAHLFLDDHVYFFTGAVYHKRCLLATDQAKKIFIECLYRFIEKFEWELFEWVVLDNHYHFLCKVGKSQDMPKFVNTLHKTSAFHIKKMDSIQANPFWYQYWDRCVRNENHYFKTAAYILFNPIKHGYTDQLENYPFSSYHMQRDEDFVRKNLERYKPEDGSEYGEVDDF